MHEIADRLRDAERSLIDVTLQQFSLSYLANWSGSKYDYILRMVSEASDDILFSLAHHVGFEIEHARSGGLEPPFWRKGYLRLFLSHLSNHRVYAAELQENLVPHGISAFVAHNEIQATKEWEAEIQIALGTCDVLVALLHPYFHESNWTDQEIGFAMGRGLPVFSVRFGQDPYGFIGRFQAFNGRRKRPADLALEVVECLKTHKQTRHLMASAIVTLFEEARSFADARERIQHLEKMDYWSNSFAERLRTAVDTNAQIGEAWGVPDRIERLIKVRRQTGG